MVCGGSVAEKMYAWSPYAYCLNSPVKFMDKDGEFPLVSNAIGAILGAMVEYVGQVTTNTLKNGFSLANFTDEIDVGDILISAGEGFITSGTSVIKNSIAKTTVKLGTEVLRNAVDIKNNISGNFEVSTNSPQEIIVNTSLGIIGGEINTNVKARPINTKSVIKTTEAAREINHNKGYSFSASQAKQVQIETKQYNATVEKINNVISDHINGAIGSTAFGIMKIDENEK